MADKQNTLLRWLLKRLLISLILVCGFIAAVNVVSPGAIKYAAFLADCCQDFSRKVRAAVQPVISPSSQQTVYKWQTKDGVWHFSEAAPQGTQAREYEEFTLDANIMTMPQLDPESPSSQRSETQDSISTEKKDAHTPALNLLNPADLKEKAETAANKIQKRQGDLDNL